MVHKKRMTGCSHRSEADRFRPVPELMGAVTQHSDTVTQPQTAGTAQTHGRPWWAHVILGSVLLTFVLGGLDHLHQGDELAPYDTAAYLSDARSVHESGGPMALPGMCFRGTYLEANQMPLYIGMLSVVTSETLKILGLAKLLTLFLGTVGILVTFVVAERLYDTHAALLAAALLACNTCYLTFSTMVACEPLLTIWCVLAWLAIVQYLRHGRGGCWVGLFIGLAYMTKGTGLFLVPVALATFVYRERRRFLRSKQVWLSVLVFLLVSSPILVRNVRCYGSPFYNTNQSFIWTDSLDELYSPDPSIREPTFCDYWRRHSLRQMAERVLRGGFKEGVYTVTASGQTYLLNERLGLKAWPIGLLILALAAVVVFSKREQAAALPAAGIFVLFFVFFTWYPAKDIRFLVPLLPMILALASRGAVIGIERLAKSKRLKRKIAPGKVVTGLVIVLTSGSIVFAATRPNVRKNPMHCYATPPSYHELVGWLSKNVSGEKKCMLGPSHAYSYFWTSKLDGKLMPVPWVRSMEKFQDVIKKQGVSHVVIDYSTLRNRMASFRGWIELDGQVLALKKTPPGWKKVFASSPTAPAVMVFSVGTP